MRLQDRLIEILTEQYGPDDHTDAVSDIIDAVEEHIANEYDFDWVDSDDDIIVEELA